MADLLTGTVILVVVGILALFWLLFPIILWIQLTRILGQMMSLNQVAIHADYMAQKLVDLEKRRQEQAPLPVGNLLE